VKNSYHDSITDYASFTIQVKQ